MRRTRIALTVTTVGLTGLLTLTACGAGPVGAGAPAGAASDFSGSSDLSAFTGEAMALRAVGLEVDPSPEASGSAAVGGASGETADGASGAAAAGKKARHPRLRKYLRKNTLHGEITVQGKGGVKTVVVQRGTVTAVTATTVSVKSTDGFTLTWTFGDKLRVVQDKKAVAATTVKTGAELGVAGAEDGDKSVARLIAIK